MESAAQQETSRRPGKLSAALPVRGKGRKMDQKEDKSQGMELAMEAGRLLLENGAEIFRVSGTIRRISRAYGAETEQDFVLSNGIFMTGGMPGMNYAKVLQVPVGRTCLEKIAAVNELSRKIEAGQCTVQEAAKILEGIRHMPEKRRIWKILSSGLGSGSFCCLFDGNAVDGLTAFMAGMLLYLLIFSVPGFHLSKITGNIAGGLLVTCFCGMSYHLGIGEHMNYMIVGSVMPMIPGVAFVNSIREVADGDYISGAVRMLDTLLVFFCIALGVGTGIFFLNLWMGGVPL